MYNTINEWTKRNMINHIKKNFTGQSFGNFPDNGQFHLHGHTHKKSEDKILLKQFEVGIRANSFRPVNISELESWISKYGK